MGPKSWRSELPEAPRRMSVAYMLMLDEIEKRMDKIAENMAVGSTDGNDPQYDDMVSEMAGQAFDDLRESLAGLRHPAENVDVMNFCAKLQRACARSLTKDDAEYLSELSKMVSRMGPSVAVLDAALADVFARSDGNSAPAPKMVHESILRAQARVDALGNRIEELCKQSSASTEQGMTA
jgi:hypothetical protein